MEIPSSKQALAASASAVPCQRIAGVPSTVRLVVADGEPIFRYGLRRLFEATRHIKVVGEASDMAEAIAAVRERQPDLLLMTLDIRGGGAQGLRALESLQKSLRCIVLTKRDDPASPVPRLCPLVFGVVPKEASGSLLIECIQAVKQNQCWFFRDATPADAPAAEPRGSSQYRLTNRETEVVAAVVDGASNKDIAAQLGISLDTVKHHLCNIFNKTGVGSRLELAVFALYHGLASLE